VETFVTGFVLVPLFTVVPTTDYYNVRSPSIPFQWMLLVPSGGSNLVCAPFAFVTALREPGHLFDPFPTFCNYCCTVLVCFVFVVGEPTLFSVLGSSTPSSFWIRSEKDHPS
jgi:hypothetical protein